MAEVDIEDLAEKVAKRLGVAFKAKGKSDKSAEDDEESEDSPKSGKKKMSKRQKGMLAFLIAGKKSKKE